jgi:hypothetical protein
MDRAHQHAGEGALLDAPAQFPHVPGEGQLVDHHHDDEIGGVLARRESASFAAL